MSIYVDPFKHHNNPVYVELLFANEEIRAFDIKEYAQELMIG